MFKALTTAALAATATHAIQLTSSLNVEEANEDIKNYYKSV